MDELLTKQRHKEKEHQHEICQFGEQVFYMAEKDKDEKGKKATKVRRRHLALRERAQQRDLRRHAGRGEEIEIHHAAARQVESTSC